MEIEKLMCHHSATKERINFGTAILFLIFFISIFRSFLLNFDNHL